jgi:hypothetical protein
VYSTSSEDFFDKIKEELWVMVMFLFLAHQEELVIQLLIILPKMIM